MVRFLKNLFFPNFLVWKYFPQSLRKELQSLVQKHEQEHYGEFQICVEGSLPLLSMLSGATSRKRAHQLFKQHKVWNTKKRSGILFYVLLAENSFEIIADEGVIVTEAEWRIIAAAFTQKAKEKNFKEAFLKLLTETQNMLIGKMPSQIHTSDLNEISDELKFI